LASGRAKRDPVRKFLFAFPLRKERLYWDNRWTQRQQRPCPCGRRPSPRGKQGEDSLLHTVLNEALLVCLGLPLETTEREAFRLETFSAQLAVPGRPRGRDQRPRALDQLLSAGWAQGSTRRLLRSAPVTFPHPAPLHAMARRRTRPRHRASSGPQGQ